MQELQVPLFEQELKTPVIVSVKRLEDAGGDAERLGGAIGRRDG